MIRECLKAPMTEEVALGIDGELVGASTTSPAAKLCWRRRRSSHRDCGLTVFQITIFTRSHGRVFGLARWGDAFDESVVVGLLKEGNGQALCL